MGEVKLIIWDLDDTLWQGTLAEGDQIVPHQEVIERIKFLIGRGVVHSICSKNDHKKAKKTLKQLGILDLFIFPSISFEDKGPRVKNIIHQVKLREQNVLFVDDNAFVLREVVFHNPNMMAKTIDEFMKTDISNWGKEDSSHKRLAHYKILEKKEKNRTLFLKKTHDEQAFLKQCGIQIKLIPLHMEDPDIERVIELVNRSNQMNFTQSRIKYDYLFTLFELKNGINFKIHVKDNYGDYGIAGYVCILNNSLFHFVFSCRILGMCIEAKTYQWIKANYPDIKCEFNSARLKQVNENLDFINIAIHQKLKTSKPLLNHKKILVRGPCLGNAISFLLSEHYQVDEEIFAFFEFANLHYLKQHMNDQHARFDKTNRAIKHHEYNTIINFLESDYYSGHYKVRNQHIPIASNYIFWKNLRTIKQDNAKLNDHIETIMLDGMRDLIKFNLEEHFSPWPRMEKIARMTVNKFGERWRKILHRLFLHFVFKNYCGYVSLKQFESNVRWYIGLFPEQIQLVFINPPEHICLPILNTAQNQKVAKRTQKLNQIMRGIAKEKPNVLLLEMTDVLEQEDIVDSFSHLKRQGYIKLSKQLVSALRPSLF